MICPARTDSGEQVSQWELERFCHVQLIGIVLAGVPMILFLRTIFMGQSKRSQAVSDFKKQIDYLVWMILILIGCGLVYSLGRLILSGKTLYHFPG